MPFDAPSDVHYAFGPYRLEPAERRLLRDGAVVELPPKEFDLLTVLVERAGQLVTKDALLAALWPDAIVEENALSVHVSRLRAALGESARDWHFVETVPRAGYRFAPVVSVERHAVVREREAQFVVEGTFGGPRTWGAFAAGLALAAALAVAAYGLQGGAAPEPPETVQRVRPSVVPGPAPLDLPPGTAAEAYTEGRAIWWGRTHFNESLMLFRSAVLLDSTFALGYVGIADVLGMGYQTSGEARALLDRALALDPTLGEAYASLGLIRTFQDWDWAGAEAAFERARALAPDYAPTHQWYASLLMIQRRPSEAAEALDRALDVAPPAARAVLYADRAQALYNARRYAESVADCRRALDHNPELVAAHTQGFWALALAGRADEAARWALTHEFATPMRYAVAGTPAVYAGPDGPARLFADLAAYDFDAGTLWAAFWHARAGALVGDRERAFASLERLLHVRQFHAPFIAADPAFDEIRDDSRFAVLLHRLRLAE